MTDCEPAGRQTTLAPEETFLARRAVLSCALLPAAARLTREAIVGHDLGPATDELRAVVRVLDSLGWPDDGDVGAGLSAGEAAIVREAAQIHLACGLGPDTGGRARLPRSPAGGVRAGGGPMRRLLERLERGEG